MASLWRRLGFSLVVVSIVAPILVELGVRAWDPTPRRMVIRPGPELVVETVQGVPLWYVPQHAEVLRNEACEQALRVVIVGDSILKGWGVPLESSWSMRWREQAEARQVCVHNYASSGYGHAEEWALVQDVVPELKPQVLVYEVYALAHRDNSEVQQRLGANIFDLRGLPLDEDGVPNVTGLPGLLNRPLFLYSHAYQYVTLSGGDATSTVSDYVPPVETHTLERVVDFAREQRLQLVFVLCHRLDQGFPFLVENSPPRFDVVRRVAENNPHVTIVDTAELLIDQDVEAVRLDACCHFNQTGQDLLAERLGGAIEAALFPSTGPG